VINGNYLISGGFDRTLRLWDVRTNKEMSTFRNPSLGNVYSSKFIGEWNVAIGDNNHNLMVVDIRKNQIVR